MAYEDFERGCGEGPAQDEGDKDWSLIDLGVAVAQGFIKAGGTVVGAIGALVRLGYDDRAARNLAERAEDYEEGRISPF